MFWYAFLRTDSYSAAGHLRRSAYKGMASAGMVVFTEATPNAYKAMMATAAGEAIPGGIANGIVGTFLMLFMAAVVAIPVGIFVESACRNIAKTGLQ